MNNQAPLSTPGGVLQEYLFTAIHRQTGTLRLKLAVSSARCPGLAAAAAESIQLQGARV